MSRITYFREIVTSDLRTKELDSFPGKVVGTLCNFVPEELILAAGAMPVRLCGGEHKAEREAEDFFARDVCPVVKSTLGLAIRKIGLWRRLDLLVIPTPCDGKKKLGEFISHSTPTHIMQLPYSKTGPGAKETWIHAVRVFMERLESLTWKKITRDAVRQAILLLNERQKAFREFFRLRRLRPSVITGQDALYVTGASFFDDPARWTKETLALCEELRAAHHEQRYACAPYTPRILLTGAPLIYPNFKIASIIESSGAVIAVDEICSGTQRLYNPSIPKDWTMKEMLLAITEKCLLPCTCPCFVESADRVNRLLELSEEFAIDGVIYHDLRMCQLHHVESRGVKAAFAGRNIPFLLIHSDYSQEDVSQIRTRIQAFIEMLTERQRVTVLR